MRIDWKIKPRKILKSPGNLRHRHHPHTVAAFRLWRGFAAMPCIAPGLIKKHKLILLFHKNNFLSRAYSCFLFLFPKYDASSPSK